MIWVFDVPFMAMPMISVIMTSLSRLLGSLPFNSIMVIWLFLLEIYSTLEYTISHYKACFVRLIIPKFVV